MGKTKIPRGYLLKFKEIIMDKLEVAESEICYDDVSFIPEVSFRDDLGADSLDIVEIVMEIEKAFDLIVPDDEQEKINTIGDVLDYLEENV
jgi:acyl carrier protein